MSITAKALSAMIKENPGKLIIPQWTRIIPVKEFKSYQEHLNLSRDGLNEAYEKYQNKFIKKRLEEFQDENQTFDWFQDKYSHEHRQLRLAGIRNASQIQAKEFESTLSLPEISSLSLTYSSSLFATSSSQTNAQQQTEQPAPSSEVVFIHL